MVGLRCRRPRRVGAPGPPRNLRGRACAAATAAAGARAGGRCRVPRARLPPRAWRSHAAARRDLSLRAEPALLGSAAARRERGCKPQSSVSGRVGPTAVRLSSGVAARARPLRAACIRSFPCKHTDRGLGAEKGKRQAVPW
uniref:Uncharacterized protein n=1 Tax=Setaria viridis TaxID=4556 RepID=A0A4U6VIE8_SETVI|nr:hypothetical protein SEVIR_3G285850v2 [Setaria viridis]